ncbi:hypothetical protein DICVIV_10932 [Dictyocaulus viviparus]|uniref:DUF7930 domain-containing protein n=1 Tax=Dictyocaulus viviparus TaxID=29172 RepID=A0A0D8XH39_DICVI|nr:hypothetical protein DICVIV_10932 [Dictyocaulus viviparus]
MQGCGKIVSLTESYAIVHSVTHGEVRCSLLSWIGGDGGTNAEWLTDILHIGDTILYSAVKRREENGLKAIKWTAQGFRIGDDQVTLADSYSQTAISFPEIGMRCLMGLARDDCSSLFDRTAGQTVVCAVLMSTNPPIIKDSTGVCSLSSLPNQAVAEEGDSCLFLFECSIQPPKCLRVTAIPNELVPIMQYQLAKFRGFHQTS